jgi:hypothetical protein
MKGIVLVFLTVSIIAIISPGKQSTNYAGTKSPEGYVSVDGIRYKTIQECIDAVSTRFASGTCYVPAGTSNASQVEMATGVRLIFAAGRFVNAGTQGGVFIHFTRAVNNATVCGNGVNATYLLNAPAGTQFGAVIQDEGTHNTICDLTADGNGNTTSTLVHQQTTRPEVHNVKVIADMIHVENHGYAWDIRGGSDFEVSNLEAQGGSIDAIQVSTKDFIQSYGNLEGGHFTNIYAHDSPRNGLDFNANGSQLRIRGTVWVSVRLAGNGTADDGTDDEFGLDLFGASADCAVEENTFLNVVATGNRGSGIRLKGNVARNTFLGVTSENNGNGKSGTVERNSIQLVTAAGTTAPANNWIEAYSRKSNNTKAFSTDANTRGNSFLLNVGTDSISVGNRNDDYHLLTPNLNRN